MNLIFCTVLCMVWAAIYVGAIMPDNDNSDPDIIYGDIYRESYERAMTRQLSNFDAYPFRRWRGRSIRRVPYTAVVPVFLNQTDFPSNDVARNRILAMIDEWNRVMTTCIHYQNLPTLSRTPPNYVVIRKKSGCASDIGKIEAGGAQYMSLTDACTLGNDYNVTILHEMEHAVGMNHEHQRYDRDNYIKVHRQVIPEFYRGEFTKPSQGQYEDYQVYDYTSIMHYPFVRNENGTYFDILKPGVKENTVGRGTGGGRTFSRGDVEKLYHLYDCDLPDPFPTL